MSQVFILPDGSTYDPGEIVRKSFREASGAEVKNRAAAEALEKQAADWRQRALDGRISGMDPEVRELYLAKASAAEREAKRLKGEASGPKTDLGRAVELENEAKEHDRKAGDTGLDMQVRGFHRMRARDCREAAAIARGEKLVYDSRGKHLA